MSAPASPTALDGITVLDFSTVGPAARCSRILADYGATVVKVGAPPRKSGVQIEPVYYAYSGHRGMKRVRVDLKAPSGKQAFLALAARAVVYGEKIVHSGPVYKSMSVSGDRAGVISSGRVIDRFFKKVEPTKIRHHRVEFDTVPGMGTVRAQFIVSGTGSVTITFDSAKGGLLKTELQLSRL